MKNDLPPACDFQISLTINCESTCPGLNKWYAHRLCIVFGLNIDIKTPQTGLEASGSPQYSVETLHVC